jgi:hypothetical protein
MTSNQHNPATPGVGAILEQLRAQVRAQRLARGGGEPSQAEQELRRALDEIELHRVVSAHWPLKARSLAGRPAVLVNKLVRRLLRWYINPIVEQQNAYNDAVARALRLLAEAYAELAEQGASAPQGPNDAPAAPAGPPPTAGDARELQQRLQAAVRERAQREPVARFPELELAALEPHLAALAQVSAHWALEGRAPAERAVAFGQRAARQYLRWLVNPIVEQQNNANAAIAAALRATAGVGEEQRAERARSRAHAQSSIPPPYSSEQKR